MRDESKRGPSDEELKRALPRDKAARDVRVGIFVTVGLLAVLGALFLLTDPASLRGRYMLVTEVPDAGGVRRGDPVLMKGVNIGRVRSFEMTPDERVTITMEIEGEFPIPEDSYTTLAGAGLLGGQTLEIMRGDSPIPAEGGDTLPGRAPSEGLLESAANVSERAEQVLGQLHKALDDGTVGGVRGSVADMQLMMADLRALAAVQRSQLAELTSTLNRTASGLEPAGPSAARAMARLDSMAVTMNRTSATLDRAITSLDAVMARMNAGEGTLGRLSQDDSLYVSLNRAAAAIADLAEDIRQNPRKYVNLEIF